MRKQGKKWCERFNVDPEANYVAAVEGLPEAEAWAINYVKKAGVNHVTTPKAARDIVKTGSIVRHAKMRFDATNAGNTHDLDKRLNLDEFVFGSLGRVCIDILNGDRALIIMSNELMSEGLVSAHDISQLGAHIFSKEESLLEGVSSADIEEANAQATELFMSEIMLGDNFLDYYARSLTQRNSHIEDDTQKLCATLVRFAEFDAGDQRNVMHEIVINQMNGAKKLQETLLGTDIPSTESLGYHYAGPQVMIPGNVQRGYIKKILSPPGDEGLRKVCNTRNIPYVELRPTTLMNDEEQNEIVVGVVNMLYKLHESNVLTDIEFERTYLSAIYNLLTYLANKTTDD